MVAEWDLDDNDILYNKDIISGYNRNMKEIRHIIESNSIGWKFDRIAKVDLSILRLAVYEYYTETIFLLMFLLMKQ